MEAKGAAEDLEEVEEDKAVAIGAEMLEETEETGEDVDLEEVEVMDPQHTLDSLDSISNSTSHGFQEYNNFIKTHRGSNSNNNIHKGLRHSSNMK